MSDEVVVVEVPGETLEVIDGGAVASVNGKVGVVVLTASDVGAAATSHTHAQSDVTGLTAALAGKETAGAAAAAVSAHVAATDPHGDRAFATTSITTHSGATDPHGDRAYAESLVTGLLDFKGSTDCSSNPNYPSASKGDVYVVTVAGKIGGASGTSVDIGDAYFAIADNAGGTQGSVGTSWKILEHNLIGAALVANNLSDLSNKATARANLLLGSAAQSDVGDFDGVGSATAAVTAHVAATDPHADRAFATSSIATHAAATDPHGDRAYAESLVTGLLDFKGSTDCSSNPNYPSASKGDVYIVTVAGKIGGASGTSVDVGDAYFAIADNAGGTQASVGTSWKLLEHNLVGALLSANNLSDLASASTARTNLGLGTAALSATGDFDAAGAAAAAVAALKLDDCAAPDDNTDLNASTSKHGLQAKLSGDAAKCISGAGTEIYPNGRSLSVNTVDSAAVASTTTETTFDQTYAMSAALLNGVGRGLRVRASGSFSSTGSPNLTMRIKIGSTTVADLTALAVGAVSNQPWEIECTIVCRVTGASGSLHVTVQHQRVGVRFGLAIGTSNTFDITGALTLGVSAQWSVSSASNTAKLELLDFQAINV